MRQETIDGNRLIAEFMGAGKIHSEDLKYHSSWDWLMDVVEKINTIDIDNYGEMNVMIQADQCRIGETWYDSDIMVTKRNHPVLIEMVYTCVITFVKWYNTQNSNA